MTFADFLYLLAKVWRLGIEFASHLDVAGHVGLDGGEGGGSEDIYHTESASVSENSIVYGGRLNVPKRATTVSAASRNSVVEILSLMTGTSWKVRFPESKKPMLLLLVGVWVLNVRRFGWKLYEAVDGVGGCR